MKSSLGLTVASLLLFTGALQAAPPAPAQSPVQATKPVQAPTQSPAQASKPAQAPTQAKPTQAPTQAPKTAQADSGYRTYSYQPGYQPTYQPSYRYSNSIYQGSYVPRPLSGFYRAGYKSSPGLW